MKKTTRKVSEPDDMLAEYDFSGGVRGKYAERFADGEVTVVVLDADVAEAFPTSQAVHAALRQVMKGKARVPRPKRKA
jgi:hypothetical protein